MNALIKRVAAAAVLILGLACLPIMAQDYPTRPIRIVVPFGPGSAPDMLARMVAQDFTASIGTSIVENRGGASGVVGVTHVAKSPADGYTLLLGMTGTQTINPSLLSIVSYDPLKDFTPVALLAYAPFVVVVSNNTPAKTFQELIDYAKSNPSKLTFATAGTGSMNDICIRLIMNKAEINLTQVAYKGVAEGTLDVIGGRVSIVCNSVAALFPQIKAGAVRAMVTADVKRSALLPNVPTLAEVGFAGSEVTSWYGVYGPAGLPTGITQKLNAQINQMLTSENARLAVLGLDATPGSPEQLGETTRRDLKKWADVILKNNIPRQ
jgi:tripartite-type tricarboxylate transporter receptor subunit TctC